MVALEHGQPHLSCSYCLVVTWVYFAHVQPHYDPDSLTMALAGVVPDVAGDVHSAYSHSDEEGYLRADYFSQLKVLGKRSCV